MFIGAFSAVTVELIGIPVLPFARGIYLPVHLNACIMVGGIVRLVFDRMKKEENEKKAIVNDGILFCSGMIAGEGLVGILLALLAVFGVSEVIDISGIFAGLPVFVPQVLSLVVFGLIILSLLKFTVWKKRSK